MKSPTNPWTSPVGIVAIVAWAAFSAAMITGAIGGLLGYHPVAVVSLFVASLALPTAGVTGALVESRRSAAEAAS